MTDGLAKLSPASWGHIAMLAFSALVAGSFSLGSMAAPYIAPEALNAVRFAMASALLAGVVLATGGVERSALRAVWRYPLLALLLVAYFVLMFEGLKTAAPVSMAAVFTLTPVMAAGFGWLLLRQVMTPRMALALSIGGVGALWVIFRADLSALMAFGVGRGEMVYFLGCAAHAAYAPLVPRLNLGERPAVFTLGVLVAGTLLLMVFGYPALLATPWSDLPVIVWVTIGYTAVFSTAITFFLLQYASLTLPSAKVMAYTYLTPSWVIVWEMALGRDLPPSLILGGIGLTILALALLLKNDSQVRGAARS